MCILKKYLLARLRVIFDDGSYIKFYDREAILYVEPNGHQMGIDWYSRGMLKRGQILPLSRINNWDPPFDNETISKYKKEEIKNKIIEYCRKRRIPLEIED